MPLALHASDYDAGVIYRRWRNIPVIDQLFGIIVVGFARSFNACIEVASRLFLYDTVDIMRSVDVSRFYDAYGSPERMHLQERQLCPMAHGACRRQREFESESHALTARVV